MASQYRTDLERYNREKLNTLLSELPDYVRTFMVGKDSKLTIKSQLAYAQDLKTFLCYIKTKNPIYRNTVIKDMPLDLFEELTPADVEEYLAYLGGYDRNGEYVSNDKAAKQRKLSALRSFYKYHTKRGNIRNNPAAVVDTPKVDEKNIIAMTEEESRAFLSVVESGEGLTKSQLKYHNKTKVRDITIFTLLLGTGMRISEMVGLNVGDVDLDNKELRIVRKGGKEAIIVIGEKVYDALDYYITVSRPTYIEENSEEQALFLSLKKNRISVRQVEDMARKYAEVAVPLKHITPHKLRSTFGTYVYNKTGDPALVADMLGHSSVDITMKRYAKMDTRRKEAAAETVNKLLG